MQCQFCKIVDNSKYDIIFLHGWGQTYKNIYQLAKWFFGKYSTFLIDLPGFGSNKLNKRYSIDDYVDWLLNFIEINDLSNVVLIGYSFGGKVAFFAKLKNPSIVVIGIAPSIYKNPFNLKIFLKIRLYKIGKKYNITLLKRIKGSSDYENAQGFLKDTFLNVVNSFLTNEQIKKIDSGYVIYFNGDKAVNHRALIKVNKINKNIKLIEYQGNHFSINEYQMEIFQDIIYILRGKDENS